ncbi:DUF421 domain-containing protein [Lysinibacillus endophyticus]|uniref:DUF421 domain-containing protein n=1 Tax=Ureibacillus endophyticus TaxID=1978490 RepID=UPI0031371229
MSDVIVVLVRSFLAFTVLLVLTRIMGKKQLSHLTLFDYVVGITVGSIAASMSFDTDIEISNYVAALGVWGLIPVAVGYFGLKSRKFLHLTDGRATILVKKGEVLEENLRKNHIAIEELMMLLREKGVFKVDDVEIAILETNGELSVMKKTDLEAITPRLLGIKVKLEHAPTLLVVDGHLLSKNMKILGHSRKWLMKEIQKHGAHSLQDVFLAQVDSNGNLYVDLYEDDNKGVEN